MSKNKEEPPQWQDVVAEPLTGYDPQWGTDWLAIEWRDSEGNTHETRVGD